VIDKTDATARASFGGVAFERSARSFDGNGSNDADHLPN
jgi:hypothetical protein